MFLWAPLVPVDRRAEAGIFGNHSLAGCPLFCGGGGGLARGDDVGLFAAHHCTSRPSVGPNVFWLCQRSPWMTCLV